MMKLHEDDLALRSRYVALANAGIALLGIWLLISPTIFSFATAPNGSINNVIIGAALVALAVLSINIPLESAPLGYLCLLLGFWVAASPVAFNYPAGAAWNNVFTAAFLMVLASFSSGEASGIH